MLSMQVIQAVFYTYFVDIFSAIQFDQQYIAFDALPS